MIAGGQIVAVNFEPGAGGKFIQNCMGLSQHCVLKLSGTARWQAQAPANNLLYQQKLHWALATIPPRDRITDWLAFELRDDHFYGCVFGTGNDIGVHAFPEYLFQAAQHNKWITYSAHSHGAAEHVERYWPTVRHVSVVNASKFVAQWAQLKNRYTEPVADRNPQGFLYNQDDTIYDETAFLKQMSELYKWLEWEDFELAPIAEYYRAYIAVHISK